MLKRLLSNHEEEVLRAERQQLIALRGPLTSLDAQPEDMALLDRALLYLEELFLLVVVGEFNSGKTALINAMLGERLLTEGVTPTTSAIHIIRYGDRADAPVVERDVIAVTHPADWLRDINIVDTPGTNAVIRRHQEITEDFVPRADLILFVTSVDRPFSESERAFIQRIREWGKKVIFIVNKIDLLDEPEEIDRVTSFVAQNARDLIGGKPTVFAVSSRQARTAKATIDADERNRLWAASGFGPLESYILSTLDEQERLRLKLSNPLGVARRLTERYRQIAAARRVLLKEDLDTVGTLEVQLAAYEADMRREFKYHLSHVDNVLYALAERGNRFFDETIRLQRIFDLVNADRVRGNFERQVIADTPAQVESQTRDLIDWLVDQDHRQWQGVMEFLGRRVAQHEEQMIGHVGGAFESNRQALLQSVGHAAREVVATYDHHAEAREMADSVQRAVAQTALVEVGAIGLGTLLIKVLATALADVTGMLAAGAVAALGFYVLPSRRRRAKQDLAHKISDLRARLAGALTDQFERELARSLAQMRDAVRPYTRFVERQKGVLAEAEAALASADAELSRLAAAIQAL